MIFSFSGRSFVSDRSGRSFVSDPKSMFSLSSDRSFVHDRFDRLPGGAEGVGTGATLESHHRLVLRNGLGSCHHRLHWRALASPG